MKTALIAGATGLIGQSCLHQLLDDDSYQKVIALTRRPLDITSDKLEQIQVDFGQLSDVANQITADDVFCCLGTTMKTAGSKAAFRLVDYDYVLQLATLAHQQGAKQFLLVTALGSKINASNFYLKIKGEIEQAIKQVGYQGVHIFQPSLLIGKRQEHRFSENIAQALAPFYNPLFFGPLAKYKAIAADKVASAMVTIAKQDKTGIHTYPNDRLLAMS